MAGVMNEFSINGRTRNVVTFLRYLEDRYLLVRILDTNIFMILHAQFIEHWSLLSWE